MGHIEYINESFYVTHVKNLPATQGAHRYVNESWHAYACHVAVIRESCHISHVAHMNESHHTVKSASNASDRGVVQM